MLATSSSDEDEPKQRHVTTAPSKQPRSSAQPQQQQLNNTKQAQNNNLTSKNTTSNSNPSTTVAKSNVNSNNSAQIRRVNATTNQNQSTFNNIQNNSLTPKKQLQSNSTITPDNRSIHSNSFSISSDETSVNNLSMHNSSMKRHSRNTSATNIRNQLQTTSTADTFNRNSVKSNTISHRSGSMRSHNNSISVNTPSRELVRPTSSGNTSFSSKYGDNYDNQADMENEEFEQEYAEQNGVDDEEEEDDDDEGLDSFSRKQKDKSANRKMDASPSRAKQQQIAAENEARLKEEAAAKQLKAELEEHKRRLQVYVFVCRCVAYPFIAKQPTDMVRRQLKLTKNQLQQIKDNFEQFLNGKLQIEADEAFTNAVRSYYEVFLKSDRVTKMVQNGACSVSDFRDIFRNNIEKRVRSLPEIDGLSKETVLNSWTGKFDAIFKASEDTTSIAARRLSKNMNQAANSSESILSKEQLYDLFQNILNIKKFEHQLIFNAAQLDNADEQAATIRRELDSRMKKAENIQKNNMMPKFVHKNMESTYVEELKQSISLLMNQLDNQPVGASESKLRLPKRAQHSSKSEGLDDHETDLSKLDVVLNFAIEVVVMEVKGLKSLPPHRIVFCVMELEGHNKLQTDQAEASRPIWDTSGDFKTQQPLPVIKVKLCMETHNILQDNKELGRVIIRSDPNFTRAPTWYHMEKNNTKFQDDLKIKLTIRVDKPPNLKMCGWCYCIGRNVWKKWKRRYLCLVQVSQYTFVLCSYMEKKSEPRELMTLDNFTVDYTDIDMELKALGGKFFFNAVKEGDCVTFATDEENERQLWIQALYRATGQSHKPTPPSALKTAEMLREQGDADKARKHGIEELIQADPSNFNHNEFFKQLIKLTLDYRLNDIFCTHGWLSPGQIFVLDEYQARYGVRGCFRHLCFLNELLDRGEKSLTIDPTLLHYSFAFCACHVHGNRPDGIGTVTIEEKQKFDEIKERLRNLLEYQITNYRYCFPFGRPEGALKQTLSLLERVLMKDIVTPVTPEEVKAVVRKCLENGALVNYTHISQMAKVEESLYNADTTCKKKIEDLIHLAELCIDLLQQNEEHHVEAFSWFSELLVEHEEIFWSLFAVDMDHVLELQLPDNWDSFPLFQLLNDYLRNHPSLSNGRFHRHLQNIFAPLVIRYVDLMESSIGQSIHKGFERENWKVRGQGCATSEDMLWKLDALQAFIKDLHWPDEMFGEHLENRLKQMASDMIEACATRVIKHFEAAMKKGTIIGGNGTDYLFSNECCVMVNVILDCKSQALKLCSLNSGDMHRYHTKIDEFLERSLADMSKQTVNKLLSVLDTMLKKLSRYDEGSFFAPLLSLTKPVNELGQSYVNFLCVNLEQLRNKVNDELFILGIFEKWYTEQMNMISSWLSERLDISLHPYQLACLSLILKKIRNNYELQGVTEKVLDSKTYQSINSRLLVEETNSRLQSLK